VREEWKQIQWEFIRRLEKTAIKCLAQLIHQSITVMCLSAVLNIIILSFLQMTFEVEIPEQVIILDPRVSEKDETYARIVQVGIVY